MAKSKDDWIAAGLAALERGVHHVVIEQLARQFKINKAGFYYHFSSRDDFLEALLDHWVENPTLVVAAKIKEVENVCSPVQRLTLLNDLIQGLPASIKRQELQIHAWAANDPIAEAAMRRAGKVRSETVVGLFKDMGLAGEPLHDRVDLCMDHMTAISAGLRHQPDREARGRQIKLLVRA